MPADETTSSHASTARSTACAIGSSAGALVGLFAAVGLLVLARLTRLGELVRFAWGEHEARRAKDPREAVIGLAFVLAGVPLVALAIYVAYRLMTPIVQ